MVTVCGRIALLAGAVAFVTIPVDALATPLPGLLRCQGKDGVRLQDDGTLSRDDGTEAINFIVDLDSGSVRWGGGTAVYWLVAYAGGAKWQPP